MCSELCIGFQIAFDNNWSSHINKWRCYTRPVSPYYTPGVKSHFRRQNSAFSNNTRQHRGLTQCQLNVGPPSTTLAWVPCCNIAKWGRKITGALELVVQSQEAVSVYFTSKQILPLGFSEQCWWRHGCNIKSAWDQCNASWWTIKKMERSNPRLHEKKQWSSGNKSSANHLTLSDDIKTKEANTSTRQQ